MDKTPLIDRKLEMYLGASRLEKEGLGFKMNSYSEIFSA